MTRRDTIIIATLVNLVLLATLFVTASREEEKVFDPSQTLAQEVDLSPDGQGREGNDREYIAAQSKDAGAKPVDLDEALKEVLQGGHSSSQVQPLALSEDGIDKELLMLATEDLSLPENEVPIEEKTDKSPPKPVFKTNPPPSSYVEITVKRGDALEKIARNYGTSVKAIRESNHLQNDTLKIGQILRVPQKVEGEKKEVAANDPGSSLSSSKELWVTVKSGDSPWKIAKQYNVRYEDILKLNNLTEEKAKNLKIGDKIRIK